MCLTPIAVALLLVATPFGAEAQQAPQVHRIGVVSIGGPPTPVWDHLVRQMIESLQASGWVEGQNIALEYRFDEGKRDRLPGLVGTPAALAAKKATATVPVVMVSVADPVRSGLVASLARPGANVTGMAFLSPDITFKQLELLREVLPHAATLGILYDPLNSSHVDILADAAPAQPGL